MFTIIFLSGFNVCIVYVIYKYLKSYKPKKTKIYPNIDNDLVVINYLNEKNVLYTDKAGDIESCII